jgi:uncharacterized protein (UPF0297 family)
VFAVVLGVGVVSCRLGWWSLVVKRFDPERAGPLYRLVYEALVELGEASVWDIQLYVIKRTGRFVRYGDVRKRLARLEREGLVEKVKLIGAVEPRILWRLKDGAAPGRKPRPGARTAREQEATAE